MAADFCPFPRRNILNFLAHLTWPFNQSTHTHTVMAMMTFPARSSRGTAAMLGVGVRFCFRRRSNKPKATHTHWLCFAWFCAHLHNRKKDNKNSIGFGTVEEEKQSTANQCATGRTSGGLQISIEMPWNETNLARFLRVREKSQGL